MKKLFLIIISLLPFMLSSHPTDDETIFIVGHEDDWSNVELFRNILINKLDSISDLKISKSMCCGKIEIFFTVDTIGKVDSCSIKKSFRGDIDTLFLNAIKEIDFKKATMYDNKGIPHPVRFVLPINIDTTETKYPHPPTATPSRRPILPFSFSK